MKWGSRGRLPIGFCSWIAAPFWNGGRRRNSLIILNRRGRGSFWRIFGRRLGGSEAAPSEMPNDVSAKEPETSSRAIVKGRSVGRPVEAELGADLDLRAEPTLPAGRNIDVACGVARALALHVVIELGAQREIVERADAIVPEGEQAEFVGGAGWQCGIADRLPRWVGHAVPGRAEIGIDRIVDVAGALISSVPHVALIHVIALERDMNLLVELVIVRAAVPVQVVVAPAGVVQVVDAEIDCVVA